MTIAAKRTSGRIDTLRVDGTGVTALVNGVEVFTDNQALQSALYVALNSGLSLDVHYQPDGDGANQHRNVVTEIAVKPKPIRTLQLEVGKFQVEAKWKDGGNEYVGKAEVYVSGADDANFKTERWILLTGYSRAAPSSTHTDVTFRFTYVPVDADFRDDKAVQALVKNRLKTMDWESWVECNCVSTLP